MKLKAAILFIVLSLFSRSQTYNYYFGNLHSHTGFSDGSQDFATSGINTPAGAYPFAKLSQNFNFLGISEHNHNTAGFSASNWSVGINQANAANQDGTFLCLFGMEWGVSSTYNGHVLIYGFPQLIGWESGNYQIFNAKTDYDGLFKKVKNQPGAFVTLAHPGFTDFTTNGASATALANAPYNSAYDSAIVGTPLRSGLYNSTNLDYSAYPAGNYFAYYQKLLSKGYHLGMTYDHDNHNTTFGRATAGRLVILAPSLTRADFYTAMQNMHFYGSDDWNAKVSFNMNGNIMGSILTGSNNPTFNVTHNDVDGELADSIKIWRGISNNVALGQIVSITKQNNTASYTDNNMQPGIEYYYYAEIKQTDGQWIVTSPIWYTNTSVAGVKEDKLSLDFNYFPNPVSQQLSISAYEIDHYKISIVDVSGRLVFQNSYYDKNFLIDISNYKSGIYTLKFENNKHKVVKKLIIE
jgi:hypothetical protein